MRRILTLLLPLAVVAVIAAGCGSDNNDSSSAASTPASTSAGGDTVVIKMQNTAFDPASTSVKVGTKVEWENEDSFDHNVKATSGADFTSDNFGQGKTFDFTADKAGTIKYVCTIHPGMEGTLTVTE